MRQTKYWMRNELQSWIRLVESETTASYYVHVSPVKNLRSILAKGLLPNVAGGNYSGYETSLSGTYITKVPQLIRDHISARMIENGFVLVLVEVHPIHGVIDEDALGIVLMQCINSLLKSLGLDRDTAIEELEPDDPQWKNVIPMFRSRLGIPNPVILKQNPELVEDYVDAEIQHTIYEADIDGDFWESIKDQMVMAFPQFSGHPVYGNRYSLRIPGPIGYTGDTRIIAVIESRKGADRIVKGDVPWAARALIDQLLN